MKTNKILVADDHSIVIAGIKIIIREIIPFAVFDEAHNGDEVMAFAKKNDYDLIVLDINMPATDSVMLISNLLAFKNESRILIFSMNSEELYAKRFLKLGVKGYLNKESKPEEMKKAVNCVLHGNIYTSQSLNEYLLDDMMSKRTNNPFEKLSDREMQIAKYLLHGYSHAEIKKTLNLHSSTIGTHKTRFFEKLKIKSLFELSELARLYQVDLSKL